MVSAAVASLSGGQAVAILICCGVIVITVNIVRAATSTALVEVGPSAVLLLLRKGGAIEIVEHQVHISPLLSLELTNDRLIPVDLNPDVCVLLP